jgi:hypothetical protein
MPRTLLGNQSHFMNVLKPCPEILVLAQKYTPPKINDIHCEVVSFLSRLYALVDCPVVAGKLLYDLQDD